MLKGSSTSMDILEGIPKGMFAFYTREAFCKYFMKYKYFWWIRFKEYNAIEILILDNYN